MPIPITIRDYRLLLNTKIPNQNQIPKFLLKNDQFCIEIENEIRMKIANFELKWLITHKNARFRVKMADLDSKMTDLESKMVNFESKMTNLKLKTKMKVIKFRIKIANFELKWPNFN